MVEKDTTEFSRESFKEKILRQLEEGMDQPADIETPTRKTPFERPVTNFSSEEPSVSDFKAETPTDDGFEIKQNQAHHEFLRASNEPYRSIEKSDEFDAEKNIEEPLLITQYSRKKSSKENTESQENEPMTNRPSKSNRKSSKNNKNSKRGGKKKKNTAGRIIAVIVLILLIVAGATGWYGFKFIEAGVRPLNPANHTIKAVNVPAGASSKQIGDLLQKDGIIKNGMIFQYYTKFNNYTGFKSGYYNLSPDMTLSAIAKLLEQGGTPKPVEPILGKITIPEGYTLEQIAQGITKNAAQNESKTPFTTAEFMKVVQDPTFIAKMKTQYPSLFASLPDKASGVKYQLEGYLFPATYEYTKKSTMESLVTSMIAAMNTQLNPYYGQITTNGMTVNSTLAMAALVEKEANNDDDRRNVAGVFYNRLNAKMPLQSNSSVLYAEGKLGAQTTLKQDTTIDTSLNSPFNLYVNTGTGPGPIDSPSLSSIKAVLDPAQNSYYYFVADVTTGKVYFAKTLAEQNANVQTYVNAKLK